jgi:hypothetical protein
MIDFTVADSAALRVQHERLAYLVEKIRVVNQAIDNSMPDEALLELRRTQQTIESWYE